MQPQFVAFDGGLDHESRSLVRIFDTEFVPILTTPDARPFKSDAPWIGAGGESVTKLSACDGSRLGSFPAGDFPVGIAFDSNRELWEVKTECEASQSEVSTRTELLTSGLLEYGFTYRVVLDHELAKQPRLDNAKTLLRYGRRSARNDEREYVRLVLKSKGHFSWSEICAGAFGTHSREIVCGLVLEGGLSFDVDSPLGPGTQFLERRNH